MDALDETKSKKHVGKTSKTRMPQMDALDESKSRKHVRKTNLEEKRGKQLLLTTNSVLEYTPSDVS